MASTGQRAAKDGPQVPDARDLLAAAARITRHVDRTRLDAALVAGLAALWPLDGAQLYQVVDARRATARRGSRAIWSSRRA